MASNSSSGNNLEDLQAIVVSWEGPWELEEACNSNSLSGNGLYLLVGRVKYKRKRQIIYVGITERRFAARLKEHKKENRFHDVVESEVWFGSLDFPKHYNRPHLERAEKMIIREWETTHNIQGTIAVPHPTCLVMRWYCPVDSDSWRPRLRRPSFVSNKPDILWSQTDESGQELVWHGALKQRQNLA